MKDLIKIWISVACFMPTMLDCFAQEMDCKAKVQMALDQFKDMGLPGEKGTIHFFDYSVKTKMRDEKKTLNESRIKIYQSADRIEAVSDQIHTIVDTKVSISELKARNMIVITDVVKSENKLERFLKFAAANDSMLQKASVLGCKNSGGILKVKLNLNSAAHKSVDHVVVTLEENTERLVKLSTFYTVDSPFEFVEYEFHAVDEIGSHAVFDIAALHMFFHPDGSPKPEYASHQIMDVRAKN